MPIKLSESEIEAGKSPKGGFSAKTLAAWGVPWPPPHGWKQALLKGEEISNVDRPAAAVGVDAASPDAALHKRLLHQVVMAMVNAGQGHILNDLPEVAAYYNCQIPTVADLLGEDTQHAVVSGEARLDDRVFSYSCSRLVRPAGPGHNS